MFIGVDHLRVLASEHQVNRHRMAPNQEVHGSRSQEDPNDMVDPLIEQMSGLMRLHTRPLSARQHRTRRFSDTDRSPTTGTASKAELFSIRSRDGSKWLPAPDEVSHTTGAPNSIDLSPTSNLSLPDSRPLQPHSCSLSGCAVTIVLETTELLERILTFIEPRNLLILRQTNSHWDSTLRQSPHLRLNFFIFPEFTRPAATLKLLPLTGISGLLIEIGEPLHLGQWIHVSMTKEAAHSRSVIQTEQARTVKIDLRRTARRLRIEAVIHGRLMAADWQQERRRRHFFTASGAVRGPFHRAAPAGWHASIRPSGHSAPPGRRGCRHRRSSNGLRENIVRCGHHARFPRRDGAVTTRIDEVCCGARRACRLQDHHLVLLRSTRD